MAVNSSIDVQKQLKKKCPVCDKENGSSSIYCVIVSRDICSDCHEGISGSDKKIIDKMISYLAGSPLNEKHLTQRDVERFCGEYCDENESESPHRTDYF